MKLWKTLISGLATKASVAPILQQIGAFLKWALIQLDTNLVDTKVALNDKIETAALAENILPPRKC